MQNLISRGVEHCKQGNYEKAVADFNTASKYRVNETLLYNRAKAYFRLRLLDEALNDLNTLIDLFPGNAEWYAERAVIYHYHKKGKEALEDLDKAVSLDPENGFRYASRAFIKDFYGDLAGAVGDYEQAIHLDPDDAVSFNNKGLVEEKLGFAEKAKASFAKADTLVTRFDGPPPSESQNTSSYLPKENSKTLNNKSQKLTFRYFLNTAREVISSKKGAQSFLNFIFGKT
jgi:tetratricopeptide (TPR) repeat protein